MVATDGGNLARTRSKLTTYRVVLKLPILLPTVKIGESTRRQIHAWAGRIRVSRYRTVFDFPCWTMAICGVDALGSAGSDEVWSRCMHVGSLVTALWAFGAARSSVLLDATNVLNLW